MPWHKARLLEDGLQWEFEQTQQPAGTSGEAGGNVVSLEDLGVQWA